jgi:hypothetical protein
MPNGDPGGRRSCQSFRGARKAQQTPALARYAHDVHPLWDDQGPATARLLPSCAANARSELVEGLKSLGEYLSSWAAFDDWLRRRGLP